jgi:hypothetical protein
MTLTVLFDPLIARRGDGGCVETHAGQQFLSVQIKVLGCEKGLLLLSAARWPVEPDRS